MLMLSAHLLDITPSEWSLPFSFRKLNRNNTVEPKRRIQITDGGQQAESRLILSHSFITHLNM
jgi:hypothetical protein